MKNDLLIIQRLATAGLTTDQIAVVAAILAERRNADYSARYRAKPDREPREPAKRATAISSDATLTDEWRELAQKLGQAPDQVAPFFDHFKDWHLSNEKPRKNWLATWRMWVRRELRAPVRVAARPNPNAYKPAPEKYKSPAEMQREQELVRQYLEAEKKRHA